MTRPTTTGLLVALTTATALLAGTGDTAKLATVAQVTEFALAWPTGSSGSTHELTYNHNGGNVFWVTGQTHDALACVTLDGQATFYAMPANSGPHGIVFDADGKLWTTLEYAGQVVEIDQSTGAILQTIDVSLHAEGAPAPINTHPHGLGVAPDGHTLWFTGKSTGTVGRIDPDGTVNHYALPTVGSVPIYIQAGPDGNMWCTELAGNQIARITSAGTVTEYPIPTSNSRPIAITPGPDGKSMWFSEEAGNKVGRIDTSTGELSEFPLPMLHANTILAALTFDTDGNLWTQAYVNQGNPYPSGSDAIVKLDSSIVTATADNISDVPITYYQVPTEDTVMHRITQGPDGAIWFTELAVDQLGRLEFVTPEQAAQHPVKPQVKATPRTRRPIPEFCR